jgi:hypothetical protein
MKRTRFFAESMAACLIALALAAPGRAGSISTDTLGNPITTTGNCDPFGCPEFLGLSTYEQVYAAANFNGAISIDEVSFFDSMVHNGGEPAGGDYAMYLSYTSMTPGHLNLNGPPSAPGHPTFWVGTLPGLSNGELNFLGTPFDYNPTEGNLLLTVVAVNPADGSPFLYLDTASSTTETSSAYFGTYNGKSISEADSGLLTQFSGEGGSAAPEPASLVLMLTGVGLLACGRLARRRR